MRISIVISSYLIDPQKEAVLKRCVDSLPPCDDLVVFKHKGLGFCEAWNTAASKATGDYLVFIGDANIYCSGDLRNLCVENTVTAPKVDNHEEGFNGHVFCMPRSVYEKYGLYDMEYNEGVHFMDEDLKKRLEHNGVGMRYVSSVVFSHPQGGRTVNNEKNFCERVQKNSDLFSKRWGSR